jgi:hypothetical protein
MQELANVWPEGGLFAFSGVDGETCHAEPFVAAGATDGIGWRFWLTPRVEFHACAGAQRLVSRRMPQDHCLSDCWHCTVCLGPDSEDTGLVEGAFVDRASMTVSISLPASAEGVFPDLAAEGAESVEEDIALWTGEGWGVSSKPPRWWLALCRGAPSSRRRFGLAISYRDGAEAAARARKACAADLKDAMRARMKFYEAATLPESLSDNQRRAFYKAVSVQKVNIESAQLDMPCQWTTPDRMPHRHMWLWDSAFHSLGLQYHSMDLAEDAIRALFAKQRPDGKLSLAAQPGQPPRDDEDTQPPIVAWAVCHENERVTRPDFINEVYPKLVRYVEWFEKNRKNDNGLYGWRVRQTEDPIRAARGGESGMDNSPRFDNVASMIAVDLSSYMASEYYSLEKLAKCLERGDDAAEWRTRRQRIAESVNELLWDEETRFYYDLDEHGAFIQVKTTAGFMPLVGQVAGRDRAEALRQRLMSPQEFWSPFPVASVSQDEPSYSNDLWRGPTWPNVNVLIYYGLMSYGFFQEARELARATIREITRRYMRRGCFYECYDSTAALDPADLPRKGAPGEKGGVGFGVVADLHWTAAAFVHFVHEMYQ